ncbi:MAG: FAD-dependent oxidoreductase [Clostridia bacterium]|nr:FAD-dependent oxidoreductase [Clostridia bacterium]
MKVTTEYHFGGKYDIIVCGGGPSGFAAAVSSARKGARTLLIEQGGCLGGFWTQGLLTWLIDTFDKGSLLDEVMERLERNADGKKFPNISRFTADSEKTKLEFERMCKESGVDILYHTFVSDAVTDQRSIKSVLTESKSGHVYFDATVFIDATGDGDLGYLCGASYEIGNEEGVTQPMSLVAHVDGVTISGTAYDSRYTPNKEAKARLLEDMANADIVPSYKSPLIAVLSEKYNTLGFMVNHEYGCGLNAKDITEGTVHAREEIHTVADRLRKYGGVWKDLRVTATADMIGVREGRRIKGLYKITADDVAEGKTFDDGICTVTCKTDIHALRPEKDKAFERKYGTTHPPYQIPLRSLISADFDNLMMAGRCISGDFAAHASYRVGGPAFRTGEAAGVCAAYCVENGIFPRDSIQVLKAFFQLDEK